MKTKNNNQVMQKIALATAVVWTAVMLVVGVAAAAVGSEWIRMSDAKIVVHLLSSAIVFAACYLSAKKSPHGRLVVSMCMTVCYALPGIAVGMVLQEGKPGWQTLIPLAVGLCAGLLASKRKRKR